MWTANSAVSAFVSRRLGAACLLALSLMGCSDERAQVTSAAQCGQYCVYRVAQLLGAPCQMPEILELLPPKAAGESFLELKVALETIGFHVQAVKVRESHAAALEAIRRPFIASMGGHFIVVDGIENETLGVFDGAGRRRLATIAHFRSQWDGNALLVDRSQSPELLPRYLERQRSGFPAMEVQRLYLDAGDVPSEGEGFVDFAFDIRNAGTVDLRIDDVISDCACAATEGWAEPIAPGESRDLVIRYRFTNHRGPFERNIALTSNDPSLPVVELSIAGNISQRLFVSHNELDLGDVVRGGRANASVFVRYAGDDLLKLANPSCELPGLRVELASYDEARQRAEVTALAQRYPDMAFPDRYVDGINTVVVDVSFDAAAHDLGAQSETLRIDTNLAGGDPIELPISVRIVDPIISFPRALFLGEIGPGLTAQADTNLTFVSRSGRLYAIEAVEFAGVELEASYSAEPGAELAVRCAGDVAVDPNVTNPTMTVRFVDVESAEVVEMEIPVHYLVESQR